MQEINGEREVLIHIFEGVQSDTIIMYISIGVSHTNLTDLSYDLAIFVLGIYLKTAYPTAKILAHLHSSMVIAALFTITQKWKSLEVYQLNGEWIMKM